MIDLKMEGPYNLIPEEIDQVVDKGIGGNFALGFVDSMDGRFVILYIGRSDHDLNSDLKTFLYKNYKKFKYAYASNPQEAFIKECCEYHDFNPPHNADHPQRPEGFSDSKCPRCSIFG